MNSLNQWEITFISDLFPIEEIPQNFKPKILDFIRFVEEKNFSHSFQKEIYYLGKPFLIRIDTKAKQVYIASRRLELELRLFEYEEENRDLADFISIFGQSKSKNEPSNWEWLTFQEKLTDWSQPQWVKFEQELNEKVKILHRKVKAYKPTFFERLSDFGLKLISEYSILRIHLLKYLALLPSLHHDNEGDEVKRALLESLRRLKKDQKRLNLIDSKEALPMEFIFALRMVQFIATLLPAGFLAKSVRTSVKKMASRFIAGESINNSKNTLNHLKKTYRDATLDQLGELVTSQVEADVYLEKVISIIRGFSLHYQPGEKNSAGIYKAHVSIKVSALSHDFIPHAFEETYSKVASRLQKILVEAKRDKVFVNIDAEHYHYRDLVFRIYEKILLETPDLVDFDQTGIVVQAYLKDAIFHLRDILHFCQKRKIRMPIRLVKGAYWDAETIEARAHQFEAPQFLNKEETDLHFRQLAEFILKEAEFLQLTIGSHNLMDHIFVEELRSQFYPKAPVIEHQCLHMTYEALSHALAEMGYPTRNYMPIGDLLVGMAYLVRRIMENSSQVGVLSMMRSNENVIEFTNPMKIHQNNKSLGQLAQNPLTFDISSSFNPCNPIRLYKQNECLEFSNVLNKVTGEILKQKDHPHKIKITSSSDPKVIVGSHDNDSITQLDNKIKILKVCFETSEVNIDSWAKSPQLRSMVLTKAAHKMWLDRYEWASWIVWEAGKTWIEALADVDEAIDFLLYYTDQCIQLYSKESHRLPLGIIGVISPWNFPLAIPCGMTAGALAAGNSVILKPAEQTPIIAKRLIELLWECGVPQDVLNISLGEGEMIGDHLVKHPDIHGIIFTGSKTVGEMIYRFLSSKIYTHLWNKQRYPKIAITEMGGKNAIIVTQNAELDEAVQGIVQSALGHAGQKCSAASRVIIHQKVFSSVALRLKNAFNDIKVGSALDPATRVNPLITHHDQIRVRKIVQEACEEIMSLGGQVLVNRSLEEHEGHLVGPSLFDVSQVTSEIKWGKKEIFGPVLHLFSYQDDAEALKIFNSTEYALTGAVFSQSEDEVDFYLKHLKSGNLYINRTCTGARVAIEPFGGFLMSGTGPKAGSFDYLRKLTCLPDKKNLDSLSNLQPVTPGHEFFLKHRSPTHWNLRKVEVLNLANFFKSQFVRFNRAPNNSEFIKLTSFVNSLQSIEANDLPITQNFYIPGQKNYNSWQIPQENGVVFSKLGKITPLTFVYVASAILAGSNLTVVASSQEDAMLWMELEDFAKNIGVNKEQFEVILQPESAWKEIIGKSGLSFAILNTAEEEFSKFYALMMEHFSPPHLLKIWSPINSINYSNALEVVGEFIHKRSIAMNTMRHGASLDSVGGH